MWSGNDNDRIRSIVSRIMLNNPGRAILPNKIVEFQEAFSFFDKVRSFQYIKFHDYGYVIIYGFTVYIIIVWLIIFMIKYNGVCLNLLVYVLFCILFCHFLIYFA